MTRGGADGLRQRDPWLFAVLVLSVALSVYQLDWGLPNDNTSWAADALGPLTVLSIARRSLVPLNSGWFYFKYPLGYPLMLLLTYAPYLALQFLTGRFRHPSAVYPYGFSDPEQALYILGVLGRCLSVAVIAGTVALTYGIGRRLFGRPAGRLAAWFVATAYPMIYYAHSTNLDATYLFWLILALWATLVAAASEARWPYVVLGIAAAMAVSTKEQGFAFLLALPAILAVGRFWVAPAAAPAWRRGRAAVWNRGTRAGLLAAVLTMLIANNVLLNPRGFIRRVTYLSGKPVPGVSARLAPVEFKLFKGAAKEWDYVRQLVDAVESSLGLPLFVVVVGGVGYVAWRKPRAAAFLLVPAAVHYYLSLRTLDLITLRYTLPLSVIGGLCAAALCADALSRRRRTLPAILAGGLCALALARGVELDRLLRHDTRYQAEAWMRQNIAAGSAVEIYQKRAYLPRFAAVKLQEIPLAERTIDGVAQRRPDFIFTSSAAKKGITHRWNPDWRQGHTLLLEEPQAAAFLRALETEKLGYRRIARFSQRPVLLRLRITSLCPEISIFQRVEL